MKNHLTYQWWKEAVGYQIYPKSFLDTNGDGIGDIQGITNKIDYLKELGIDFIWICPFFKSPMDDNGYDVSDYYDINPLFGDMDDIKHLIEVCKSHNIRIIIDLVLNHTSDEHPWFVDVKNNPNSPYREFYIIKNNIDGKLPNNWGSFFGGSVWEPLNDHESYLKIFSNKMPDLNWESTKMQEAMFNMANWWLDLGVDGFRVDAIAHLAKVPDYKDSNLTLENGIAYDWSKFSNLELVHTHLKNFNKNVLEPHNAFTVGEVGGGAKVGDALNYCGYERNELDMTFTFDHIWCNNIDSAKNLESLKTNVPLLKETLSYWQNELFGKAWYPLYLNNHDFTRTVSNYGSIQYHQASAKALATMMYLLWGTPFIYQGEEIGMTNYPFESIDDFLDVSAINQYNNKPESQKETFLTRLILSSRDHARTSMQWDASFRGGFSSKDNQLVLTNDNFSSINVEQQLTDDNSVLNYYKKLINLKKTNKTFIYGEVEFIDIAKNELISYYRFDEDKCYLVVVSLHENTVQIELQDQLISCLLSNYELTNLSNQLKLKPYETCVFEVVREK